LLGGFILVPLIGLKGCWLLTAALIATMSGASLWLQIRVVSMQQAPLSHGMVASPFWRCWPAVSALLGAHRPDGGLDAHAHRLRPREA
jgi:hypothetical protein